MQLIQTLEIPSYIIRVKMSDKRRKKYYRKTKKGKWKPRNPLPKTYQQKLDDKIWRMDKNDKYLLDENGNRILANPQTAGKPRYKKLSGNDFASGYGSHHIRANIVNELKDFYRPFVAKLDKINSFPLWVDWHLYTTIPKRLFDLTNFWFYYKYLEDCLFEWVLEDQTTGKRQYFSSMKSCKKKYDSYKDKSKFKIIEPVIPDDNIKYITKPGTAPILHPIKNWDDRKFIFNFYHDDREELSNYESFF